MIGKKTGSFPSQSLLNIFSINKKRLSLILFSLRSPILFSVENISSFQFFIKSLFF